MMKLTSALKFAALAGISIFTILVPVHASDVTVYDSVISLATNVTQNYTFTDPTNGLSVVVAVTMTPSSSSNASPAFSLLDYFSEYPSHMGIDGGLGHGDGNWVDGWEAVNFSASLVSASDTIPTNTIQFSVAGLGIRPEDGTLIWTSSAVTNQLALTSEGLATLETSTAPLAGQTYSGQLHFAANSGRCQLSEFVAVPGQSIAFRVFFGYRSPTITVAPSDQEICQDGNATFTAVANGSPIPTIQWQVQTGGSGPFSDVLGATNTTLTLSPTLADNGNQYQAVFTNSAGSITSSPATLTISPPPSAVITFSSTAIVPGSITNTASGPAGVDSYLWSIDNGTITSDNDGQSITFFSGYVGQVTLTLITGNALGCSSTSSTNISINAISTAGLGTGIYVTDDNNLVEKFDTNGTGSLLVNIGFSPAGLAFDQAGNLFEANYDGNNIIRFATNGSASLFATNLHSPAALAFDGSGNLFVTCNDDGAVRKIAPDGTVSLYLTNLDAPSGLAFDQAGNLYVADYADRTITQFDSSGHGTLFASNVFNAIGMAFDAAGNLFVADYDDTIIFKITPDGTLSTFATNNLTYPNAVTFDAAGNLYAANDGDGSVTKFATNGSVTIWTAGDMGGAEFVAAWPLPAQLIPANNTATAALLSSAILSSNQFYFTVTGTAGANYIVQATTNLADPTAWSPVLTNASPFSFTNANTSAYPQRFFRAVAAH